jgi:hypothetical protein
MEDERRSTYRAQTAESRPATLRIGGRSASGYILDESSGGLCFLATSAFPAAEDEQAELTEINNGPTVVRVAYVEQSSLRTRIGLRRSDTEPGRGRPRKGSIRPWLTMATIGALAGLALGLLVVRGPKLF